MDLQSPISWLKGPQPAMSKATFCRDQSFACQRLNGPEAEGKRGYTTLQEGKRKTDSLLPSSSHRSAAQTFLTLHSARNPIQALIEIQAPPSATRTRYAKLRPAAHFGARVLSNAPYPTRRHPVPSHAAHEHLPVHCSRASPRRGRGRGGDRR